MFHLLANTNGDRIIGHKSKKPEVDPPPLYDGIGVGIPMPIGTYATRKTTQQQISSKRTLDSYTPITK